MSEDFPGTIYVKGDIAEFALWYVTPEEKQQAKKAIRTHIEILDKVCVMAPVKWREYSPGEDRCPLPREDAPHDIRLIAGESEVMAVRSPPKQGSFVNELDKNDLSKLRTITRKAHARQYATILTDPQCDEVIEKLGPSVALKTLRS